MGVVLYSINRQSSTNVNLDPIQIDVSFSDNMFDLENDRLDIGTMYDVVVSAFNSIGEGPTSNVTQYTRVGSKYCNYYKTWDHSRQYRARERGGAV